MSAKQLGTAIIDRLGLLLGAADIGAWTYMSFHGGNECQYFFDNPILSLALILLFIAWLLKSICCNYFFTSWIPTVLAVAKLVLLLAVLASMTFAMIVAEKDRDGFGVPGCWKGEYRMFKRDTWFQNYVLESMFGHGDHPSNCVSGVCQAFAALNLTPSQFAKMEIRKTQRKLSVLESTCCIPCGYCCLKYKNSTFWAAKEGCVIAFNWREMHAECSKWKNGHTNLCYACSSCMHGVIVTAREAWRHFAMLNTCILILTIIPSCIHYFWISRKRNMWPVMS